MNVMKRFHFQLRGGTKFDELCTLLSNQVDCLLKICPNPGPIHMSMLASVAERSHVAHLRTTSEVYGGEAERRRKSGQPYKDYELVKDVAEFKANVHALAEKRARRTAESSRIVMTPPAFLIGGGTARFWKEQEFEFRWGYKTDKLTLATESKKLLFRYVVSAESPLRTGNAVSNRSNRSGRTTLRTELGIRN